MSRKSRLENRPKGSKQVAQKKAKIEQTRLIQIIALAVILIVAAGLTYLVYTSQKPAASSANTAATPAAKGSPKQYSAAPPMTIDVKKQYSAQVKMANGGQFTIQLYADQAPITVNSFVFLARDGYFNGTTFHRVLEGFMAQGGDPTGTGSGGPGYEFVNEDNQQVFVKAGVVAMANAGRDTNGSQFFITFAPQPSLNGGYTIFGQVTDGMDVVNKITRRDPTKNPTTPGDAIDSVTITEK